MYARDPSTGLLKVSYDDGLTWEIVPDGPYDAGETGPYAAPPPPLGKGSDDLDRCWAAANATLVIAQFYKETVSAFAAGLYNAILDANRFLFTINQTLLRLIYPDAVQLGLANDWTDFDWATYATPPERRKMVGPIPFNWPWEDRFWKPTPNDRVRELVKAGALIAAEIDRVQRLENKEYNEQQVD